MNLRVSAQLVRRSLAEGGLAEAGIAAEEFAHWAAAKSVEEYLGKWSVSADWPIARNDKLLAYWPAR